MSRKFFKTSNGGFINLDEVLATEPRKDGTVDVYTTHPTVTLSVHLADAALFLKALQER